MSIAKLKTKFTTGAWLPDMKSFFSKTNEIIDHLNGVSGSGSYKVYSALISQSGTDAPTVTILNNTLGNIVWIRDATGQYTGILDNELPLNKTFLTNFNTESSSTIQFWLDNSPPERIRLATQSAPLTPSDDLLFMFPIEIKVYN